jgi:ABC-2 type transport system ATP-binding protein
MGIDVVSNPVRSRQRLALVPQKSNLDKRLRARELLLFHASYHAVPRALREARADALLAEFGLAERAKDNVNHFSGGMAQRLMLARALMHTPDVLVLDEPTNSLDPQSRLFLWDRIHWLNAQGMTILLTTHDMDEAEQLCDRIAIMDQGRILELDTMDALQKLVPGGTRLELRICMPEIASPQTGVSSPSPVLEALRALPGVAKVEELAPADGEEGQQDTILYRLYAENIEALAADVIQAISSAGATLRTINITRPGLEDVFITLTGRNLRS